jgi:hypothetical protein
MAKKLTLITNNVAKLTPLRRHSRAEVARRYAQRRTQPSDSSIDSTQSLTTPVQPDAQQENYYLPLQETMDDDSPIQTPTLSPSHTPTQIHQHSPIQEGDATMATAKTTAIALRYKLVGLSIVSNSKL